MPAKTLKSAGNALKNSDADIKAQEKHDAIVAEHAPVIERLTSYLASVFTLLSLLLDMESEKDACATYSADYESCVQALDTYKATMNDANQAIARDSIHALACKLQYRVQALKRAKRDAELQALIPEKKSATKTPYEPPAADELRADAIERDLWIDASKTCGIDADAVILTATELQALKDSAKKSSKSLAQVCRQIYGWFLAESLVRKGDTFDARHKNALHRIKVELGLDSEELKQFRSTLARLSKLAEKSGLESRHYRLRLTWAQWINGDDIDGKTLAPYAIFWNDCKVAVDLLKAQEIERAEQAQLERDAEIASKLDRLERLEKLAKKHKLDPDAIAEIVD